MTRRVVLVDFYWTRDKDPRVPLGHASILAALRAVPGLDVRSVIVAVNAGRMDPDAVARRIFAETTGLPAASVDVAIGVYVWGEALVRRALHRLRAWGFAGRIVLGGPQISYSGPGLEALYPRADAFVRGYGEEVLAALAESPDRIALAGVHWAGDLDRQLQASVDLERLPSPWLTGAIDARGQAFVRWETQRGCPFRCAFCQHREAGARLKHRALGLPRVEAEIDLFCASGVRDIAVLDPIFNMAPHAVGVLRRFAERGYTGRLSLQCRAETTDGAFLDAAAALDVQLEFGLQTIHEVEGRAIERRNHIGRVDAALAGARARGIRHEVTLIFGLPLQTVASFEQTVAWCLAREVPILRAFPLMLLRGTPLDRDRARWGLIDSGGDMPMVVRSDTFDEADWREMARLSEALKRTEGRHPTTIEALRAIADDLEPEIGRWAVDAA